jgi:hypothetical protein
MNVDRRQHTAKCTYVIDGFWGTCDQEIEQVLVQFVSGVKSSAHDRLAGWEPEWRHTGPGLDRLHKAQPPLRPEELRSLGLAAEEGDTGGEGDTEDEEALSIRSPRRARVPWSHRLRRRGQKSGYDGDGAGPNGPLPSERVLARRRVDALDHDEVFLQAFRAGVSWMMSQETAVMVDGLTKEEVRRAFERYWLNWRREQGESSGGRAG